MFEVLDFLSTIMPIVCGILVVAFLLLLVALIIFRIKKKNTKRIVIATVVCLVLTISTFIGTAIVLDAYGKAAYERSEDYQKMQESIERTSEISDRMKEIDELLEKMG